MLNSLKTSSNIVAAIVNLFFSLLTAVILLVSCFRKTRTRCLFIRFYGHVFTWSITIVVAVFLIFEILEGILSDVKSSAFHLDVHLCSFSALLASCFVLALYNHAENQRSVSYLIFICLYWFLSAALRAMNLAALIGDEDHRVKESAKFVLVCLVIFFYIVLGFSAVLVLIKQVSQSCNYVIMKQSCNVTMSQSCNVAMSQSCNETKSLLESCHLQNNIWEVWFTLIFKKMLIFCPKID